ncbi:hypothetical protein C8R46DRAFT_1211282 [Mycena filopes]|nr:hypothetical protein C8R46DRAFT_1211282 [Mycena filopes]
MADRCPQEILDLVFAQFPTDRVGKRTVAQFGLVCRNWLPSSRYRFFSDVDINDRSIKPFLDVVAQSPFPIPTFIRSLGLSPSGLEQKLDVAEFLQNMKPFGQVTTLRITMTEALLDRSYTILGNTLSSVTTLVLRHVLLPVHSILLAVSTFSALKSLVLDWVNPSYDLDDLAATSYHFPPHWDSLTVDLNTRPDPFFQALLALPRPPIFSSLSLRGVYPTDGSHFGRYLAHVGDALHYIRFEAEASGEFGERMNRHPVGLRASTGLRHLEMVFADHSTIAETVHSALTYLTSKCLVSLSVIDASVLPPTGSPVRQPWAKLDKILEERRFSTLEEFRVQTHYRALGAKITQRMPSASARGILQIIYT